MIGDHVAQRAGRLVELAALLHAHRLRRGDLHMIDPVAVPDRLEQAVGEAERHDALDRVLAEKMVDPEDLVLVQRAQDAGVQFARRIQAVAERLLDHHAAPESRLAVLVLVLIGQLRLAELLHHGAEEPIGDREIEDGVALGAMGLLGLVESAAKLLVQLGLGQVALDIGSSSPRAASTQPRRYGRRRTPRRRCRQSFSACREGWSRQLSAVPSAPGHADQRKFLRQHFGAREIVERRHHQALGQVAGGAENHHGAGIGRLGLTPRRARNSPALSGGIWIG